MARKDKPSIDIENDPDWIKVRRTVKPLSQPNQSKSPENYKSVDKFPLSRSHPEPKYKDKPPLLADLWPQRHFMDLQSEQSPAPARRFILPAPLRQDKKARRGKVTIEARIDLHGLIESEAFRVFDSFLRRCARQNKNCVLVITGKGARGEGVLRRAFADWINTPELRALISSYAPAHLRHGGGGAWYVFLKT